MSKVFLGTFGVALAVIGALVWAGFIGTSGNHLEPTGKLGKLRIQPVDDNSVVVIADFSIVNDSDRTMQIRSIDASLEMPDGAVASAGLVPSPDVPKIFKAYPLLGEQFNEPLHLREEIPAHKTVDRMLALRLEAPAALVEKRKRFVVKIEDVTGPVLELSK
jgi:hypothetical protein